MKKIIGITPLPNRFLPVAPAISFKKNWLWVLSLCLFSFSLHACADYALQDGDTIAFLGDSITAARQYSKIIEDYTLLRFPERKIRFINAGRGGETAKGGLARLQSAVFDEHVTVLTVAYGINDIAWGTKADAAHKKEYLDSIAEIIDRCQQHGVRVFICSAAITAEDPGKAETGFLQTMGDEALALAKSKGAGAIDVQRYLRAVQRRVLVANAQEPDLHKQTRLHVEDGVHLNELGQMAMASAILKGLGAEADVSSATIDAAHAVVLDNDHCRITGLHRSGDGLSFVRRDERLPLNLATFWMLQSRFIPIGDELNRYLITVKNLPAGSYAITAGGRGLGSWHADELARGINIASATTNGWEPGGPWDAQGYAVKTFTDMRDELVFARRDLNERLTQHPGRAKLDAKAAAIEKQIIALQRETARPVPVEFEIRRVGE